MSIRVAFDISLLAKNYVTSKHKDGIFRVTEEVLTRLMNQDDIEMTPVAVCHPPGLHYAAGYLNYLHDNPLAEVDRLWTPSSSLRWLINTYSKVADHCAQESFKHLPRFSLQRIGCKRLRKLLSSIPLRDIPSSVDGNDFDVLHSTYQALPPPRKKRQLQCVLTVYDLIPLRAPEFVTKGLSASLQAIVKSVNLQQDWVICISEHTKQEFCEYTGMSPERVFVTLLAAAPHFYPVSDKNHIAAIRKKYGIPEGNYFLSLARLERRKNLIHLINTYDRLLIENPTLEANLVLVGEMGGGCEEIQAAAENVVSPRSKIFFTGYVDDDNISALYSGATAFVYPSLYEGFGLPPLEAMQCGVPVITSDTTALPEVVGQAGITVPPTDSEALCDAMLRLSQDLSLWQDLSHQGLERAKEFSWEKCAEATADVYRKIMNSQESRFFRLHDGVRE